MTPAGREPAVLTELKTNSRVPVTANCCEEQHTEARPRGRSGLRHMACDHAMSPLWVSAVTVMTVAADLRNGREIKQRRWVTGRQSAGRLAWNNTFAWFLSR